VGLKIDKKDKNEPALLLDSSGPGWGSGMQLRNTAQGGKTYGIYSGFGSLHFTDSDKHVDRLLIHGFGNVGIGTSSPTHPLHVKTDWGFLALDTNAAGQDSGIRLMEGGAIKWHVYNSASAKKLFIDRDGLHGSLTIDESGNVGIGTTSPGSKLHVSGDVRVSGRINCDQWRVTRILSQTPGPLPFWNTTQPFGLGRTFTSAGGTLLIFAFGSGFSSEENKEIGMDILIDSRKEGEAKILANEKNSHKAFVGAPIVVTSIGAGDHRLDLFKRDNLITQTDSTDYFDVTVLELPFR